MANIAEEAASKGMGKAKAAKARMAGLTGVFRQLAEEHGEVSAMLKRVSASSDPEVAAELFPTIRKELLSHEHGELQELYPVLQARPETRSIAEEHTREAEEMETLISELHEGNLDEADWQSTFDRLARTVEQHASDEENHYFPEAQAVIGEDMAKQLLDPYLTRKRAVMMALD